MVRNEYHSECFCRASHYHAQCSLVLFAMKTPSMSSWMFACPHRLLPSQVHATSRGKSMTLHIGCHFQRRLCPCASSLACSGQRRLCSCADFGLSPEKMRKTEKRACRHKQHALNSIEMKVHKLFFQVVVFHKAVIVHAVVVARNVILDILPVPR